MEGIEGIELKDIEITKQLNLRIKLLGITEIINNRLFERVHPCLVGKDTYLGNINGVMNAVILNSKPVGETVLQGEGAGPGPTSSALLSDLLSVLRGNIKYPFGTPHVKRKTIKNYIKDHRVCMMSCIAALVLGGTWKIHDSDSINTSFPIFFSKLKSLKKTKK